MGRGGDGRHRPDAVGQQHRAEAASQVWLDVATSVHFYEALLATLAIVVWHFYSIIFDPDVYPLNTAFLTGVSAKDDAPKEHGGHAADD